MYEEIITIHSSRPEGDGVPSVGLQSHHTAAGGLHHGTGAVGLVSCCPLLLTIEVEEAEVITAVQLGHETVAHPPVSRHGYSEDT